MIFWKNCQKAGWSDRVEKVPKTLDFQVLDLIFTPVSLSIIIRDLETVGGGRAGAALPGDFPVWNVWLIRRFALAKDKAG